MFSTKLISLLVIPYYFDVVESFLMKIIVLTLFLSMNLHGKERPIYIFLSFI